MIENKKKFRLWKDETEFLQKSVRESLQHIKLQHLSEFEFKLHNYIYFQINILGKGLKPPYPLSYELHSTTAVLQR